MDWTGWQLERLVFAFIAVAFAAMWVQLTLFHWRGAFRHKAMWGPVLFTPVVVLVLAIFVFVRSSITEAAVVGALSLAALEGLIGTALHLKGIASQVGGMNLRNAAVGPPPILPLTYAVVAGFGLLVLYWPQVVGTR